MEMKKYPHGRSGATSSHTELIGELIGKYSQRLKNLKENRSADIDNLGDKDLEAYDTAITTHAEICNDLKSILEASKDVSVNQHGSVFVFKGLNLVDDDGE